MEIFDWTSSIIKEKNVKNINELKCQYRCVNALKVKGKENIENDC